MSGREVLVMAPLVIMMIVMGVITKPFTDRMTHSVNEQIVTRVVRLDVNHVEQPEGQKDTGPRAGVSGLTHVALPKDKEATGVMRTESRDTTRSIPSS